MIKRGKRKPYSIFQSFGYALSGIFYALTHERNLRIHFATGAYVLYFSSRYYSLTRSETALVIILIGFVFTCEMINTAIENTVDLETSNWSPLAKKAKDVAAGAVLVAAIASIGAGIALFGDLQMIRLILNDVLSRLYLWIPIFALTVIWIALPQKKRA